MKRDSNRFGRRGAADSIRRFSHWNKHAQQWRYVKAPLRPCAEDIALIERALAENFPTETTLDALMLGVTPELAANSWMPALNLVAVDNTLAMIQSVWPENDAHRTVLCGNWLQLPLHDACMNLAMIDGGLPAISFPDAHQKLAMELRRVLKPGGLFVARIFARPDNTESVDDVLTAAHDRQIGNFHIFKWRLAMALQDGNANRGVRVDDVWRSVDKHFGHPARLAELTGWPINEISTIDAYRGSQASYHFPSIGEMVDALEDAFQCVDEKRGTYELAERCPILVFRRREGQ